MKLLIAFWALLGLVLTQGEDDQEQDEESTADKVAGNAQRMLDRYRGNAIAAIAFLMGENAPLRKIRRDFEAEVERRVKTIQADGKLLTKDEASEYAAFQKDFKAYQALGTVAELTGVKTERDNLQAENHKTTREKLLAKVAEAEGLKPGPLTRLAGDLEFVPVEVDEDGAKVTRYSVKDGDKTTPLSEYIEEAWPEFVDSLRANGEQEQPRNQKRERAAPEFQGQKRGDQRQRQESTTAAQQLIAKKYPGRPGAARAHQEAK